MGPRLRKHRRLTMHCGHRPHETHNPSRLRNTKFPVGEEVQRGYVERCRDQDHPYAEHHCFLLVWSSSIDSAPLSNNIASILCGEQNTGIEVIYMSLICQFLIRSIKSVLCMRHNFTPPILFPTLVEFRLVFTLKTKNIF